MRSIFQYPFPFLSTLNFLFKTLNFCFVDEREIDGRKQTKISKSEKGSFLETLIWKFSDSLM